MYKRASASDYLLNDFQHVPTVHKYRRWLPLSGTKKFQGSFRINEAIAWNTLASVSFQCKLCPLLELGNIVRNWTPFKPAGC